MGLVYKKFKEVNLKDPFFNSLKDDYEEFPEWFTKKGEEYAYVHTNSEKNIDGFLYLKVEEGSLDDVRPIQPPAKRLKVGTFKIDAHGTKLGERFIKKVFDYALTFDVDEVYVTAFEMHAPLLAIFDKYGFLKQATKTTKNGVENVYIKSMRKLMDTILKSYPLLDLCKKNIYTLALYPKWHTRLLPDSILKNEDLDIIKDISHTNSIHKVYLAAMAAVEEFKPGDVILIYRTSDNNGPAHHRSVVTSVCVLEENRHIDSFADYKEFISYCRPYSIFEDHELVSFWKQRKYPYVIRFTYNVALKKRVTRGTMIEECGLDAKAYAGVIKLSKEQFLCILDKGQTNESFIVH